MKMFSINLWSCKFLLASNEWQVTLSPAYSELQKLLLTEQALSLRSSRDLFLIAVLSSISQTCVSHSSTPTSLFVPLSVGGRITCTLPPRRKVSCYNFNQRALLWTFESVRWPLFYSCCKISYFDPLTFYFRGTNSTLNYLTVL